METIREYKVYENQSWVDVSNYLYGTPQYAYELAEQNQSAITEDIMAGSVIKYNTQNETNKLVLSSYVSNGSIPATAITAAVEQPEGISYWAIGVDFIVQ